MLTSHSSTKTGRRARRAVAATGLVAVAGALFLSAQPASAASTMKTFPDADTVKFNSPTISHNDVSGTLSMTVTRSGHYSISGSLRNGNIAWRNITAKCTAYWTDTLGVSRSQSVSYSRKRIDGKERKTFSTTPLYTPQIQLDFNNIVSFGFANCDFSVG
jgi:uncharacterized protein YcfL